ncbi:efflux RND transporter periplasmic adaptor subunit, partial [Pseudomonadota bacterium]
YRPMNSTTKKHRWWVALVLTVLVVAGILGGRALLQNEDEATIASVVVELGDIERTVTAVGALKPKEYVDVGTQVSGRVEAVHFDINDRVKKGDLIAEIDASTIRATIESDRAQIENLEAQIAQLQAETVLAKQQHERNLRMAESRAVSEDTVDQSQAAVAVSEARVRATRAQLRSAQATLERDLTNLDYTKIYAPMDGTVVSQTTLEGQTVNANQSTPIIVQVANLDLMTVWAQVTEADINRIQPGMSAYFTTLGMPDRRWTGTVRQVQPTPEVKNDVVLYNVLIDVQNDELLLLPEMTVQVFFVLEAAQNVPVVPLTALKKLNGNRYEAAVVTASGVESREVTIGVTSRLLAEVRSGLTVGDRVLIQSALATTESSRRPRIMGPRL